MKITTTDSVRLSLDRFSWDSRLLKNELYKNQYRTSWKSHMKSLILGHRRTDGWICHIRRRIFYFVKTLPTRERGAQISEARRSGRRPDYIKYIFVFLGHTTICRSYKLTLSDQAQVSLQLTVWLSDLAERFLAGPLLLRGPKNFSPGPVPLSAALRKERLQYRSRCSKPTNGNDNANSSFSSLFWKRAKNGCELDLTYGSLMALSHTVTNVWIS